MNVVDCSYVRQKKHKCFIFPHLTSMNITYHKLQQNVPRLDYDPV